jgi:predicted  nucleic acid-binding Zn-ribbon protein
LEKRHRRSIETISEENIDLKHRIADTEKKLAELEKAIHEMLKQTD